MDAAHLYKTISKSLSTNEEKATGELTNSMDACAILVHAWALHVGLVHEEKGFGLDNVQPLDATWKRGAPNFYSFRYSTRNNQLPVDVTVSKLNSRAVVSAMLASTDTSVPIALDQLVNDAFFERPDGSEELRDAYNSDDKVEEFCSRLSSDIWAKLDIKDQDAAERIHKERQVTEEFSRSSTPGLPASRPFTPQIPGNNNDPNAPPGFEDEYEMNNAAGRRMHPQQSPMNPSFGDRDLYPPGLGPNPPMQPFIPGGGAGGGPTGGGMHPTFDDPLFQQQGRNTGNPNLRPPGARYDPTGPGDFNNNPFM